MTEAATHHALWLTAVLAGLASFFSPCILPLIPGYLSMISGLSAEELQERRGGRMLRVTVSCLLFGAGVSAMFVVVGLSASVLGHWLRAYSTIINVALGVVVIFFGLFVLGVVKLPFLYQDRRLRLNETPLGMWGAPLLGLAFGFGWTPCLSPYVGALATVAFNEPPLQAAVLFAICGGTLTLCFAMAGVLFSYALGAFSFLQRHYRVVEVIGGVLLIAIGILLVTQQWGRASSLLMRFIG